MKLQIYDGGLDTVNGYTGSERHNLRPLVSVPVVVSSFRNLKEAAATAKQDPRDPDITSSKASAGHMLLTTTAAWTRVIYTVSVSCIIPSETYIDIVFEGCSLRSLA